MQNQENKPPTPMPRRDIPEGWVKNGRCPACGSSNLKVTRLPDAADYMSCAKCGVSFEVENGGRYVRLKYLPDELEFVDVILRNRWVEAVKLAGIIAKHRSAAPEKKVPDQPSAALPADDAWKRALRMYQLGNNPRTIQTMLTQSGLAQEQADTIFARLKQVVEDEAQQQNKKFWTTAGISIIVLVLLTGTWLAASGKMGPAGNIPTKAPDQPPAVGILLESIPADAQVKLAELPATTVETGKGPGKASCPDVPEDAAKLFGGDPSLWHQDTNGTSSWGIVDDGDSVKLEMRNTLSWLMTSDDNSITVRVPSGMTAGYMENKSFSALSVEGPAIIRNVNFLVITCD